MAARTSKAKKTTLPKPKKLYRSESDRIIAGVCGGLADYFEVDPTLIRLILILLVVFGGSGVFLYILLWLFIPTQSKVSSYSEETIKENAQEIGKRAQLLAGEIRTENTRMWTGVILLVLGVLFLFQSFGLFWFNVAKLWPLILIAIGVSVLMRNGRN